jgi:hypothetical protein
VIGQVRKSERMIIPYTTEKEKELRRTRIWYKRYFELAVTLKKNKCDNIPKVLEQMHNLINETRGYRSNRVAISAYNSMLLVIEEIIDGNFNLLYKEYIK